MLLQQYQQQHFLENATVRGRAWYKLLDVLVLTLDVTPAQQQQQQQGAGGAGAQPPEELLLMLLQQYQQQHQQDQPSGAQNQQTPEQQVWEAVPRRARI